MKEKPVFTCSKCTRIWRSRQRFVNHVRSCEGKSTKAYPCEHCPETLNSRAARQNHIRKIHSGIVKECQHCHKTFTSDKLLSLHIKIHVSQPAFQCFFCPQKFLTQRRRYVHCKKEHPEDEKLKQTATKTRKIHKCFYCEKSFTCKTYRKKHEELCSARKVVKSVAISEFITSTSNRTASQIQHSVFGNLSAIDSIVPSTSNRNDNATIQDSVIADESVTTPTSNRNRESASFNETPSLTTYSRDRKPFMKLGASDVSTPRRSLENLKYSQSIVKKYQRKVGVLQQTIRRLKDKLKTMEDTIEHLEKKSYLTSTEADTLSVGQPAFVLVLN